MANGDAPAMRVPRKLRREPGERTLDAIAAAVDEAEARTSGEIVVHVVRNLLPLETPRARAVRAFFELGVHRTRARNGVLLFVVMKRRCFEIVADEAIDAMVGEKVWEAIAADIGDLIAREGFEAGICRGVSRIGDVLSEHYPPRPGDVNELPDRPSLAAE